MIKQVCWSCGRREIFCNARHFFIPIFEGLAYGLFVGCATGAVLALVVNFLKWAGIS